MSKGFKVNRDCKDRLYWILLDCTIFFDRLLLNSMVCKNLDHEERLHIERACMITYTLRRLITATMLLTITSSSLGYPISYGRLYNPSTGVCVDVIGDLHLHHDNDAAAADAFLEALTQLDAHTKTPINVLWEGGEASRRLIDAAIEKLQLEHQDSLFLINGWRKLKALTLHNTTVDDIDHRPREVLLALFDIAKGITSGNHHQDERDCTSLSEQILTLEQLLTENAPALTVKDLIHAYQTTERTLLDAVNKLDENCRQALQPYIQSAYDEWQTFYTSYLRDNENETFASCLQSLASRNKLNKDFSGAATALLVQLGDAMFAQKTCQGVAECPHTVVVTGVIHAEQIATVLKTDALGFLVCHNIFPLRGNVSQIIPNELILLSCIPNILEANIPALDQDTWKHLGEDPEQSYETSTDYVCVLFQEHNNCVRRIKEIDAWIAENKKARERNDRVLAENDRVLAENVREMEETHALIKHNNETLAIWDEQIAILRGQGKLNNHHS